MSFEFSLTPQGFNPVLEVAGCFCEHNGKVLYLKRNPEKYDGNFWGIPGGKLEAGESKEQGVIREVFEEAGIVIPETDLRYIGPTYCRNRMDYVFHVFMVSLTSEPELNLALAEHTEGKWVTVEEGFDLPLMKGGKEVLEFYQDFVRN